jgi:hypothetical protein
MLTSFKQQLTTNLKAEKKTEDSSQMLASLRIIPISRHEIKTH